MKNKTWIVISTIREGKLYAWMRAITQYDNLQLIFGGYDVVSINVFTTKKLAAESVKRLRETYIRNGIYQFDEPKF